MAPTALDIMVRLVDNLGKTKMDSMRRFLDRLRALSARRTRGARDVERVRVEDALKHLHECEQAGRSCAVAELAGRVGIGEGEAAEVAARLAERGLARPSNGGLALTEAGRGYARQVLRTHRLWERYLADRTGVPAGEWHAAAERVEHELSPAEAERLASRLGDPRYDPHGDPIPTAAGEVPAPVGLLLTKVPAGRSGVVTHLEDEPREVFDRLVAAGLAPGVVVDVVEAAAPQGGAAGGGRPDMVRARVGGVERMLGVVDAGNVSVALLPVGSSAPSARRTLAEAAPGESVVVAGVAPACQGPQRRRLLDLGVVPGTVIVAELASPSGDPVAYRIRGALVALRRDQARWIEVEGGASSATEAVA
jgi:DtxR family transcriptional regulator, Mn-dependent transcriptional regulator